MIVCDECRDVNSKAFDCTIILEKEEDATTKRQKQEGTPKRMKRREVVRIPVALCERCITKVCKSIGIMKARGTIGRMGIDKDQDNQLQDGKLESTIA